MGCCPCISIKTELTHFRDRHKSEQKEAQEDPATAQEAGIEDRVYLLDLRRKQW